MVDSRQDRVPPLLARCQGSMDRAIKTFSLYAGRGDRVQDVARDFHQVLGEALGELGPLLFEVTPWGPTWHGVPLFGEDKPSPYYFDLFKDGVRELSFLPGVSFDEVRALLRIIVRQVHLKEAAIGDDLLTESRDQDAVTRLWEAELTHIQYYAVDAYATGEVIDPRRGELVRIADEVRDRLRRFLPGPGGAGVPMSHAQPVLMSLERPVDLVRPAARTDAVVAHGTRRARTDEFLDHQRFVEVWAALVEGADAAQHPALAALMTNAFRLWLDEGDWQALRRALDVFARLGKQRDLRAVLHQVRSEATTPTELLRLQHALARVTADEVPEALNFFRRLPAPAREVLGHMLAEHDPSLPMARFERGFALFEWDPRLLLMPRLKARNPRAAADAARRLGSLRALPGVTAALRAQLEHADTAVRDEVLKALKGDDDPATLAALGKALEDPSPILRNHAIRLLAAVGNDFARAALHARVEEAARDAERGERRLLLTALARLGGPLAAAWFAEVLAPLGLLATKRARVLQAEAREVALRLGTPDVRAVVPDAHPEESP